MIVTEKLPDSQQLDPEFKKHIKLNKTIRIDDKHFWSKLR